MENVNKSALQSTERTATGQEFSLLGGPLYRLGSRLGLVRRRTNTVRLGLVLGLLPWIILLAFAVIDGLVDEFFGIKVIGAHVRLLVLIPLLFVCESALDPRAASFVDRTLRSRTVAVGALPALESEIARSGRWKDSWLAETFCLVAALLMQPLAEQTATLGVTTAHDPAHAIAGDSLTATWWLVCLTLARFLILRLFYRLVLWSIFLWRISRLELNLLPHHPDRAGGLGGLETVHRQFVPMIVAFAAVVSASFAEEMTAGTMVFGDIYLILVVMLVIVSALFVGPVLVFMPKLRAARIRGSTDFRGLAARYVQEFESKWLSDSTPREPLVGTADIQSLADLANSADRVQGMRILPVSPHILKVYALSVVLPFLPLLLLQYPIEELASMLFRRLSGL